MEYFSIGKFAKETGKSIQTLRNWDKSGKLKPAHLGAGGARYYTRDQVNEFTGYQTLKTKPRITIGYCRVNYSKQKEELERQIDNVKMYMLAKGYSYEMITDIGSGMNYGNPGLLSLIDRIENYQVDKVVVLQKDRLLKIGYELLESICKKHGTMIEIIDHTKKKQDPDVVDELVQVMAELNHDLQGKKVKKVIQELMDSGCE